MPIAHRITFGIRGNTGQLYVNPWLLQGNVVCITKIERYHTCSQIAKKIRITSRGIHITCITGRNICQWRSALCINFSRLPFIENEFAHAMHQLMDLRDLSGILNGPEAHKLSTTTRLSVTRGTVGPVPSVCWSRTRWTGNHQPSRWCRKEQNDLQYN